MATVILKKKGRINEDGDVTSSPAINDPNIASKIANLNKQKADEQKRYNDIIARIDQQIAALQQEDANQKKAAAVANSTANAANNQQQNESFGYAYRKAIRLSKRLYESLKNDIDDIGHEIKAEIADLDLSYTMDLKECKNLARKIKDVLDNSLSKKDSDNKWPDVEKEIRKYFKNNQISLSSSEKREILEAIKGVIMQKPEYDWVFGNENEQLSDEIKQSFDEE